MIKMAIEYGIFATVLTCMVVAVDEWRRNR